MLKFCVLLNCINILLLMYMFNVDVHILSADNSHQIDKFIGNLKKNCMYSYMESEKYI